jgi:hypothetical protein
MTLFFENEQKGDAMICEALKEIECLQEMVPVTEFCSQDCKITPLSLVRSNPATERAMP